ncbi:diacylglycerol/lipid kinase family protein [Oceanithermus sp.]
MEPVTVIVNPAASRGKAGAALGKIRSWVRYRCPEAELVVSEHPGHVAEVAAATPPGSRIVAVGGDGTVHEVLGVIGPRQTLGIVPIGSGNDIARMAGLLGRGLESSLETAVWGEARRYDLGVANGEPFGSSATAGLDASVARRAFAAPRFLRGLPRYLWALLLELRDLSLPEARVEVDGREVYQGKVLITAAMNSPTYGGGFLIAPMARPDDGRLDLIRAGSFGRLGVLGILPRLVFGKHLSHPQVGHAAGVTFAIEFDREVPLQADGELLEASNRLEVRVRPGELLIASDPRASEKDPLPVAERELSTAAAARPAGVVGYRQE